MFVKTLVIFTILHVALAGSLDCSTTACPTNCNCIASSCSSQLNDCLNDSTCSQAQDCADACKCGDKACLTGCAAQHPSAKGLSLLACASSHCTLTAFFKKELKALPDCSTTACPATCSCIESNCTSQINDCLADSACAAGQTCADKCACGDKACLTSCAMSHPSSKALSLLACASSKCTLESVFSYGVKAMPDCSTTACPSNCQCIEQNCASQISDCLADGTCSQGQTCADNCACGDKACLSGCAAQHPSAKGLSLLACASSHCSLGNRRSVLKFNIE